MILVQSILGKQWQFQVATASCKHRGRGLQTQKWISWNKGTEGSPTSWPSPAGTPVGAYTVGSALLQVARVQLQWWIQHQRRGIGTHQWSDLNDIWMDMLHYAKTHKTFQRSYLHSPLVLFHWMIHLKLRYLQNMDTALLELHLGYSIKNSYLMIKF